MLVVSEYWDTQSSRVLEIAEFEGMPQEEVALQIVGPKGGFYGQVVLDRRAAAKLGEELVARYGRPVAGDRAQGNASREATP
jgi:hypothetical protein